MICILHRNLSSCRVRVLCPDFKGLTSLQTAEQALQVIQQQGNSDLGFLQFFNLHRSHTVVADLVQDSQLPKIAAQLLGVRRLRLYQVPIADGM